MIEFLDRVEEFIEAPFNAMLDSLDKSVVEMIQLRYGKTLDRVVAAAGVAVTVVDTLLGHVTFFLIPLITMFELYSCMLGDVARKRKRVEVDET